MVLLSTQTASDTATISFTTGINSTYKEYQFWYINILGASSTALQVNFSTDSGSNYNVTKTSTFFSAYQNENGTADTLEYSGSSDLAQSTAFQPLGGIGNDADQCGNGILSLFNPANTTFVKHYICNNSHTYGTGASSGNEQSYVAGYCNTTSAVNAVQFKMSTGNINGTILMYGIV